MVSQEQSDSDSEEEQFVRSATAEQAPPSPIKSSAIGCQLPDALATPIDVDHLCWQPVTGLPEPLESTEQLPLHVPTTTKEKGLAQKLRVPPRDVRTLSKLQQEKKADTTGSKWYNMPAPIITDDVKRDLRLLRLRNAFDPKRHYKSFDTTKFPKYFQFGTVVEGPTEFYSGRLAKRERKGTITEELLADAELAQSRKKRYNAIQEEATKWSKKKNKRRKTDNPRINKRPNKPKH